MAPWFPAFGTAVLLACVSTPLLRRLALQAQFVDMPDRRKVHRDPVPYLGGVALIVAVLSGLLYEARLAPSGAVLLLGAALLGTMGLIDDDRHVEPGIRLASEVAAAVAAVSVGLRVHATGIVALDVVLTIVWVVGVTNAFNLMDNMDGLAAGTAGVAATAVFILAVFGGQPVVATVAAATMGACCGFLLYNRPPASIFMGDTGSLFLGFVLAILTVDINLHPLGPPFSFIVPLMLLALPVLDTTTVTLARIRRRRPVSTGGQDHLSHRLVKRGFTRAGAVGFLVAAEAALGALAVVAGRRVIPLWAAVLLAALVVGVVAALAVPVRGIYREKVRGMPTDFKLGLLAVVVGAACLALPSVFALLRASGPAREAAASAERALEALSAGDNALTVSEFRNAERSFEVAQGHLRGPLISLGRGIPGLSSNLHAARTLVEVGYDLSTTGARLAAIADSEQLPVANGTVSLDEIDRLGPLVRDASQLLKRSQVRIGGIERGFLAPPLADAVNDVQRRIDRVVVSADRAATSLKLLPRLLGGERPYRYFLAFQNNAETRGSGGLIGNWAELVAEDGHLSLTRFGRNQELNDAYDHSAPLDLPTGFERQWSEFQIKGQWQHVNVSPDFPTTGQIVAAMYPHSGGAPLDGVIGIDPPGLASLLELTGPVLVPGWPEPVTAQNVVDVTLRDAYARFPNLPDRVQFLSDVARIVTEAFTSANLGSPATLANALSKAARGRHLMVYLTDPEGQKLVSTLGADGAVPPVSGDSIMVVSQNLAANKIDYYMRRTLRYDIRLDPSSRPARIRGSVEVEVENGAAATGLPPDVIGPYDKRFEAGENRTYLSVYGPFLQGGATLEGRSIPTRAQVDLGRQVRSVTVSVPARESRTISFPLNGRVHLSPQGWYRVDIPHQPVLEPDRVELSVTIPSGWRVVEARGARVVDDGRVQAEIEQTRDETVWLRVERTGLARIADRLLGRT